MPHSYLSDIDREQFNKIKSILESARKKTRPRTVDLYDVICGISYVLKSGCQWRMLPKEFPKLRKEAQYQPTYGNPSFCCFACEKTLNRLLDNINYHRAHREHREGSYELFS